MLRVEKITRPDWGVYFAQRPGNHFRDSTVCDASAGCARGRPSQRCRRAWRHCHNSACGAHAPTPSFPAGATEQEAHDALLFAAASLVVLALMPNHTVGPYSVLNPRRFWELVILIMAISGVGYIALRLIGPRPWPGFCRVRGRVCFRNGNHWFFGSTWGTGSPLNSRSGRRCDTR